MPANILNDIQKGLTEKRAQLEQWRESAPEAEVECCLASEQDAGLEAHLHVIDESLAGVENGTLGVCEICHEAVDSKLLTMDYTARVCLSHYSEEQLNQLENDLELSQVVQRGLLPQQVPSIAGLDIAAFSRPAQIVGGDYFDFLQFKDGAHGLVIADVSGHGMSSGILMTSLQTAFHTLVPETLSPVEVLERINRLYIHNIKFTTFVTIFFGRFDLQTRTLTYANAGHSPALLYRKEKGEILRLEPTGAAIGLIEGFTTRAEQVQLMQGDRLLLYTDGITEATNPHNEQFGEDRLAAVIQQNQALSAKELIQAVRESLNDFMQGVTLADDLTLVACAI
jgi:sigma-B regulation protein RsbU (phosphoserine phosphatase)